jgi:hypothetical protein
MGPCSPCDIEKGSADASIYRGNIEYLQTQMGYRFRITKVNEIKSAKAGKTVDVKLTVANEGIAPAYKNYTLAVALIPEGSTDISELVASGSKVIGTASLMPETKAEVTVPLKISADASGKYTLVVYFTDGDGKPILNLGMADSICDKVYGLYTINIK